jgi:hypothetical protein
VEVEAMVVERGRGKERKRVASGGQDIAPQPAWRTVLIDASGPPQKKSGGDDITHTNVDFKLVLEITLHTQKREQRLRTTHLASDHSNGKYTLQHPLEASTLYRHRYRPPR